MPDVVGLLLAAGAGRRMGTPKALVNDADGTPWLTRAIAALRDGGCDPVVVVIGAQAADVRTLVVDAEVVEAPDWAEGMGASLRAGLRHLAAAVPDRDCAVVHLVDIPDVGPDVVARLVASSTTSVLARAAYDARPGHPVLIGRDHWVGVADHARGDRGARDYLASHRVELVDCSDLATGADVDTR